MNTEVLNTELEKFYFPDLFFKIFAFFCRRLSLDVMLPSGRSKL